MDMGVCVILKQISSTQLLVCVCVCNGSAPRSAIKEVPRDVCLYTRKIKGRHGCVYVSVIITLPSTASCVCMYMHANTTE